MLIPDLDDVQYDMEVEGTLVRRQIARKVWEERGWATVAVKFEERESDGSGWKPPKVALLRFRKMHDAWKKEAAITLSADTAHDLAATLADWG